MKKNLTLDYIRGLIEGEATFTFCTSTSGKEKVRIPAFQLRMHIRDKNLIEGVRDFLNLKNKVYVYHYPGKDGSKRGPQAMLIVRELGNLKNKIVPLCYDQLVGYKATQFNNWLDDIGNNKDVPNSYKIIYFLHKNGFYRKNPTYLDIFVKQ
ncbi:hypothetical protein COV23_02270 [Candidatus Wolfebacteria bacterium CG10_big_fil_rev_8_21_14_0_10_31_9]|uniref:Homing endonuclease LAGLIDADG domain-containing protein n=1 Tax=Candidatus Wolfebacteria bacterium CG10_big_fil_rev_8_21_14_0_10_31_9 TaxID=1975070 RepID=A0A2H0RBZ3_9BACT|nr:MAG: hypothetical protein COV23_02270 [Candidatus Wolfebacteria bacterium CG10_big_fil_rev_8_21_14_0_10_31_9]